MTDWPKTPAQLADKFQVSGRTLRGWIRRLCEMWPGMPFCFRAGRAMRFEKKHYEAILTYLPSVKRMPGWRGTRSDPFKSARSAMRAQRKSAKRNK